MYKRLAAMGDHVVSLGKNLDRSVKSFNQFVGSIEGSVMPQARKFTELEVEGTQDALVELEPIEADVRQVRSGRDLTVSDVPLLEASESESAPT